MSLEKEYYHYLNASSNTEYPFRQEGDISVKAHKTITREKQTTLNVLNYSLLDIDKTELQSDRDKQSLDKFKDFIYEDRLAILKLLLKCQSFCITEAVKNRNDILLPNLGKLKYNRFKEYAYNLYKEKKDILNTFEIKQLVKDYVLKKIQDKKHRNRDNKHYIQEPYIHSDSISLQLSLKLKEFYGRNT